MLLYFPSGDSALVVSWLPSPQIFLALSGRGGRGHIWDPNFIYHGWLFRGSQCLYFLKPIQLQNGAQVQEGEIDLKPGTRR